MGLLRLFSFRLEQNTKYISLQRHIPILFDGLKLNQEECYLIGEKGKKEGINRHLINSWFSLCDVGGPLGSCLESIGLVFPPCLAQVGTPETELQTGSVCALLPQGDAELELFLSFFLNLLQT